MQYNSGPTTPLCNRVVSGSPFPRELIEATIKTFLEEDGVLLSEEEAMYILRSFAKLYLAFST